MSRLFITQREIKFISDITKEFVKDIVGQKIFLYPISEIKTQVHSVYNEAIRKVFDNPISVDAIVDAVSQTETKLDKFGADSQYKLEVFLHYRDLVEKGINISIGDYFSYSDVFYEITEKVKIKNIYGLAEHTTGFKITGTKARETQFNTLLKGPTDISRPESDAIQITFVQQRGLEENKEGLTHDTRELVENGVLDEPLSGVREVSQLGEPERIGSSFYDED